PGGGRGQTQDDLTDEEVQELLEEGRQGKLPQPEPPRLEDTFTQESVRKFLFGEITWGQLHAVTKNDAYLFAQHAYAQYESGRYFDARKVFQALVIIDPYDSYYHMMHGACFQMLDERDAAIDEYTAAIQLDETNMQARVNRAELYLQSAKFPEALHDLQIVTQNDPEARDAAGVRARALAAATAQALQSVGDVLKKGEPQNK
ncbi:MAG: tetratricopeptide repeat protein, partial [Clostridia bacterium]|nr:tetratricopeptide repeat protein [Deltaproteobacteria bacterium]